MPRAACASARKALTVQPRRTFPRTARLTKPVEYRRVFEESIRSSDSAFTVLARRRSGPEVSGPRLGLAISRKCARHATTRNRIKRVVRESFRHMRDRLPGVDIIVLCRPAATSLSNAELATALDRHWQRIMRQCANS